MATLWDRARALVRPRSLEGSRWEPAAAGLCAVALGGVFGSDILTPDDVLAALGLPPLLAAVWTLSAKLAAVVAATALALFGIVVAVEAPNRTTLLTIGATGLVLATVARWCASIVHTTATQPAIAGSTPSGAMRFGSLTRRELEVARLGSQGYTAAEIAGFLHISERTVETHLAHVYAKLGVTSKRALVRMSDRLTGR